MKILFTVENYYPEMSGVPNVVKYLAEKLVHLGNEVTVVTRAVKGCPAEETLNFVKIIRKNIYYTRYKGFAGNIEEYIKFVVNFNCDAIIFECSQCITTDLLLPHLKEINKKKILHSHGFSGLTLKPYKKASNLRGTIGNGYNWFRWNLYYNFKFKKYVKDFDDTICLSDIDSSKDYLDKYAKRVYVLSNAADDMFFEERNTENKISDYTNLKNNKYFLSVANYQEYKNQIGILKQFFISKTNKYDLVFIGSNANEYYEELIKQYKKLQEIYGAKPVHFLTGVARNDIPAILRNATLYLVGSTFEEFSISLIESMAVGVPFISTDVGNARLLPGGITIKDISNMADSIDMLIADNVRYVDAKMQGKSYAKSYCRIDAVTNNLLHIISEV